MTGKSPQRHVSRRKRKKVRHGSAATSAPRQEIPQRGKAVAQPRVVAPTVETPATKATPKAIHYPYIAVELRQISVLGGIMLAILVVLALVLS